MRPDFAPLAARTILSRERKGKRFDLLGERIILLALITEVTINKFAQSDGTRATPYSGGSGQSLDVRRNASN